ncbi:MAG TPA: methylmalonyl-CoA mutase family protein [Jatrophihabitantaceae bacterium]|nr:methylmalonyl-CoA mutase family protein [Jatrophihabitantaceae bacterium]
MSGTADSLALAADFPAADRDEWRTLVAGVLAKSRPDAGADPEAALISTTYEGIEIKPLYTRSDAHSVSLDGVPGHSPFVRASTPEGSVRTGWDVRQRHADPDPGRTNAAVQADLNNGATSLWLVLGDAGLAVSDLAAALDGVYLDLAPVALDAGAHTREAADAFLALVGDIPPAEVRGTLGADPIGWRARTGADADLAMVGELAQRASTYSNLHVATIDASIYHDAGANDADEIATATSVGVAYLRALTDAGFSIDDALSRLEFRFAVNADQFLSIAKLRAARRVWDRVAELSGASSDRRGQWQHATTSAAMMTRRDPWVNMLRTTVACFAAAVGGADAVTVLPFDAAIGLSDAFARRIARNTQSVLHDESSLARVIDAAGGSWYIESLTDQLAEKAWESFTAVERADGALAALDDGRLAAMFARSRSARMDDIAHRRAPLTGVSEFAFVDEQPVIRDAAPAEPSGGSLPAVRYAAEFESFRDRAESGDRPKAFLAALGPLAVHSARVGFASNLLQAGGIEPVVGTGQLDDIVNAFRDTATSVAVICSSDKVYAESAEATASALRDAGASYIWLAGKHDVPGVDGYLYAGVNVIEVLARTFDELGVPA